MKRFVVIILAVLVCASASAQGKFGVVGGMTSSQLKIKDLDFKSGTGFQVGVAYNQPLILGFALQPELVYNEKKTSLADVQTKMSYIELPVQIQWGIDLIALKPYIFAEPFVGYALGGNVSYDGPVDLKKDFDLDKLKSRLEYGFSIGAGINLLRHIQISAKYFWNFENAEITSANDYWQSIKSSVKLDEQFTGLVVSAAIFF